MFDRELKKRVRKLEELVRLLDYEVRYLNYEKAQRKNPDKKLLPPSVPSLMPMIKRSSDMLSIDELKRKYRGSTTRDY